MTNEPKTEQVDLTLEQLDEARGGATSGAGALENVSGANTWAGNTWTGAVTLTSDTTIGLPAVQRTIIAI